MVPRCQATFACYPQERCVYPCKYGDFCGFHRKDKKERQLCEGLTKSGKKCTNPVKRGQYCHFHVLSDIPEHDYFELTLYRPDINWPAMSTILGFVKKVKSGRELGVLMERRRYHHYQNYLIEPTEAQKKLKDDWFTIFLMQTLFVNQHLELSSSYWQDIVKDLSKKTENLSWMKEYHLLFRKKFDLTFREQTKKNYIEKILIHSDLGNDMAKKIVELL